MFIRARIRQVKIQKHRIETDMAETLHVKLDTQRTDRTIAAVAR